MVDWPEKSPARVVASGTMLRAELPCFSANAFVDPVEERVLETRQGAAERGAELVLAKDGAGERGIVEVVAGVAWLRCGGIRRRCHAAFACPTW